MGTMKDNRLQQVKELQEKVKAIQQNKRRLENEVMRKANWEDRKARTKRLIETGAPLKSTLELKNIQLNRERKCFRYFLSS